MVFEKISINKNFLPDTVELDKNTIVLLDPRLSARIDEALVRAITPLEARIAALKKEVAELRKRGEHG